MVKINANKYFGPSDRQVVQKTKTSRGVVFLLKALALCAYIPLA
jgi:hypothetical protein